jgi:peptide/nickel transport system substrate-binding protein
MIARAVWGLGLQMRLGRRSVLGAGLAAAGVGLAGCAGGATPAPPTAATSAPAAPAAAGPAATATPQDVQPKYGGVLRNAGSSSRAHDDPHGQASPQMSMTPVMAYSGLLKFRSGRDIQPGTYLPTGDLAESWEQPDDTTYVFKLRRGVKFHNVPPVNGREVTSADVLYSYRRVLGLKSLASLLAGVQRMEAPDPFTFKVTLAEPDADLLANLAASNLAVVAREAVEVSGDLRNGPYIGTGPWIVESVTPDSNRNTMLVRNPDYFLKGLPYVDRLEFIRLADASTIVAAFRAKQTDFLLGVGPEIGRQTYDANPTEMTLMQAPQYSASIELGFKSNQPPFNDPRVRNAVVSAMDREAIIAAAQAGFGILATGVITPNSSWQLTPEVLKPLYRRDTARARQLLAEAGLPSLEFTLTVPNYASGLYVTISEQVQAQLKEAGINVTLKVVDSAAYAELVQQRGEFSAYLGNNGGRLSANQDLLNRYHSKGVASKIQSGYSNPRLDTLIDQQRVLARDPEKRKGLLEQLQRIVVEDHILVNVSVSLQQAVRWSYVKDFYVNGIFNDSVGAWVETWIDK